MRREDLEHIIRAAGNLVGDNEIVVIGSQAILAEFPSAPAELLESAEADVFPRHHLERTDEIDGAIGELSIFHDTHGYYAHGVGPETVVAPVGWQLRLVRLANGNTNKITGFCLEANDLCLAKLAANRSKDINYCRAMLKHQMVDPDVLRKRVLEIPVSSDHLALIVQSLESLLKSIQPGEG
jgi:hypothetical protein